MPWDTIDTGLVPTYLTDELKKAEDGEFTIPVSTAADAVTFVEDIMTKWVEHGNGICWEESTLLADAGLRHGVTGKSGGVSEAPFTSLNLGLHVGDQPKAVLENRRRLCASWAIPCRS